MLSSGISFGGLVSGLDTGSIISQLVALKRAPIVRLEDEKKDLQRGLTILNDLKAAVERLGAAAKGLDSRQEFVAKGVTSGNESVVTATAGSAAPLGTFSLDNVVLATQQQYLSQGFGSIDDDVGTGTVSLTIGGETTDVTLDAGASSLGDLKQAINDANVGATATTIFDGTNTFLLVVSDQAGTENAVTVDVSGLSGGTSPTFTETVATDASFTLEGVPITGTGNVVSDALDGVTFTLQGAGSTTFTVEADNEALKANLQEFADAYNEVITLANAQSEEGATLNGSSFVRSIQSRISSVVTTAIDTVGDFRVLAEAGLSLDREGQISLDSTKLDEALAQDYDSVVNLFIQNGTTAGVASLMTSTVDDLTDFASGLFKVREDSVDNRIENIDSRILREERSVESYEEYLNRRFTAMESLLNQLQAQAGFLG